MTIIAVESQAIEVHCSTKSGLVHCRISSQSIIAISTRIPAPIIAVAVKRLVAIFKIIEVNGFAIDKI